MERKLRELVEKALLAACEKGQLVLDGSPPIAIELPKEKGHGDFSTNAAMVLAKKMKIPPKLVAETIIKNLPGVESVIEKVEIAGPGFINFFLTSPFLQQSLRETTLMIKEAGEKKETGKGSVLLEFVSANPTGPLNVVNARAAAVGDTLARLFQACGWQADREFYVNDEGSQIENLGRSLEIRYKELIENKTYRFYLDEKEKICWRPVEFQEVPEGLRKELFPEDYYAGEYVKDLAKFIRDGFPDSDIFKIEGRKIYGAAVFTDERLHRLAHGFKEHLLREIPDERERIQFLSCTAVIYNVNEQRQVLERFRLVFQNWYFQSRLGDRVQKTVQALRGRGHVYEQDGAIWFKSTTFKDDKDRVLVRQDGAPTYFAADAAYHACKKEKGYDLLIDLLGPDHHGYIARTKAAVQALGYPPDSLEIYLIQLVTLMSGGKPLRMSKRAGEFITMEELLDEVGVDAARWYFLNRHRDSHLEFDLDLAKLQSEENPLYYVQYAHARISSIISAASEQGIRIPSSTEVDLSPLIREEEKELIKKMGQWPSVVEQAAQSRGPHHLPRYAVELAKIFHAFYTECRVIGNQEKDLTTARLFLVSACKDLLSLVLGTMGISAPEKM